MKQSGIERKIRRVDQSLTRMEHGRRGELTLSQCVDYIGWLARFKKAPPEVWTPLCERATAILDDRELCAAVYGI